MPVRKTTPTPPQPGTPERAALEARKQAKRKRTWDQPKRPKRWT